MDFLEHLVLHALVAGIEDFSGQHTVGTEVFLFRWDQAKRVLAHVHKYRLHLVVRDQDLADLQVLENGVPTWFSFFVFEHEAGRADDQEKFRDYKMPNPGAENHYLQFVEAVRGNGRTSTPFDYAGPLTESVLLGCLATRFRKTTLEWDAAKMQITNNKEAQAFVRRRYRKGWEVNGL